MKVVAVRGLLARRAVPYMGLTEVMAGDMTGAEMLFTGAVATYLTRQYVARAGVLVAGGTYYRTLGTEKILAEMARVKTTGAMTVTAISARLCRMVAAMLSLTTVTDPRTSGTDNMLPGVTGLETKSGLPTDRTGRPVDPALSDHIVAVAVVMLPVLTRSGDLPDLNG